MGESSSRPVICASKAMIKPVAYQRQVDVEALAVCPLGAGTIEDGLLNLGMVGQDGANRGKGLL